MSLRIVQLGTPRAPGEGLRIGTVRRPPRGVPKSRYSEDDWYDVWLPDVAPSQELVKAALSSQSESEWKTFIRKYTAELKRPQASRLLDLLAALSHTTNISIGCYCEDESHCHRSVLRRELAERGAEIVKD
jgi:uncharacterized protein YeaO (DUF488 family)